MSWECKSKKDPEKKEEKKGDKRKRGSRGGKKGRAAVEAEIVATLGGIDFKPTRIVYRR
jgi:hypothetical protein